MKVVLVLFTILLLNIIADYNSRKFYKNLYDMSMFKLNRIIIIFLIIISMIVELIEWSVK